MPYTCTPRKPEITEQIPNEPLMIITGQNILIMTTLAFICSWQTFTEDGHFHEKHTRQLLWDLMRLENKSSTVLDSHCKCSFIITPEAVCCVVSFDGQLDASTRLLVEVRLLLVTAVCKGPCFSCFSCLSFPSVNVDHRAYSVTSSTRWWFHDDGCGYCLQSWEVVSFPPPQLWSWVIIGRLVRDTELSLLSVFLSLSLWGGSGR